MLLEPRVKVGSTRLEIRGLQVQTDVVGLHELRDEGNRIVYDPHEVALVLGRCGLPGHTADGSEDARNVSSELLELLERLMRAYDRANPICVGDDTLQRIFGDPNWNSLREILLEHGIVKPESRATSGPNKEFLRRQFAPSEIMSGINRLGRADPKIVRFWDSLELKSV